MKITISMDFKGAIQILKPQGSDLWIFLQLSHYIHYLPYHVFCQTKLYLAFCLIFYAEFNFPTTTIRLILLSFMILQSHLKKTQTKTFKNVVLTPPWQTFIRCMAW